MDKTLKELLDSTALIYGWWIFTEAGNKTDEEPDFKDDQIVLNYSGNGAGCFVTVGDFRKFCKAYDAAQKALSQEDSKQA